MHRPAGSVTVPYVLAAVGALIKQRVLPHAKKADVIGFRRILNNSALLVETLEVLKPDLDPIFERVAYAPKKLGTGRVIPAMDGFSLKSFLSMCEDAQLIGAQAIGRQLSRVQIKTIFLSSLDITGASAYSRRPLLSRSEFDEALLRLTYSYDASADMVNAAQHGRHHDEPRSATDGTTSAGSSVMSLTPTVHRGLQGRSVLGPDGDARAVKFAHSIAGKLTPRGGIQEADRSEVEAAIMAKLPLVCGRLRATFEKASFATPTISSKKA